jgi:PadR family transcriptional regulator PadR
VEPFSVERRSTRRGAMGKTGVLGSFEELVLLAILRNDADAYAVPIRRELERGSASEVAMGAVYATLDRLEEKGLVASRLERRPGVPGRPRRKFVAPRAVPGAPAETGGIRVGLGSGVTPPAPDGRTW